MKIAFLNNFTINFIIDSIKKQVNHDIYIGDYNTYALEIINESSDLYKFSPDATCIFLDGNTVVNQRTITDVIDEIKNLYTQYSKHNNGYFIVSNIFLNFDVNQLHNYNYQGNFKELQLKFNRFLNEFSKENESFYTFDILSIIEKHGYTNLYDNSLWVYGKVRFNNKANELIAETLIDLFNGIQGNSKKCLVLDADNTLWGGIIGEDGLSGIQLGPGGFGEIFSRFHVLIQTVKEKGILLALCSKNNIDDVKEVFDKHPHCKLRWDEFTVKMVNWAPKDQNIKQIANELNIGEDSLVFIDDNPFERELVRENTDAIVPGFPEKNEDLLEYFSEIDQRFFSKMKLTKEDKEKAKQYEIRKKSQELEAKSNSLEEFVAKLDIVVNIEKNNENHISRISQMTQKTNQFNLTTKRYSEVDIKNFLKSPGCDIYTGNVKDRFGDHGIVLLMIVIEKKIDTFLMSCRVIGRYVEDSFISFIFSNIEKADEIHSFYSPTKKNKMVEEKYEDLGFELISQDKELNKSYRLNRAKLKKRNIVRVVYGSKSN